MLQWITTFKSSLSPIVADMVMQDLEKIAKKLPVELLFYLRYVDDIAPLGSTNEISEIFNFLHIRLQFTERTVLMVN